MVGPKSASLKNATKKVVAAATTSRSTTKRKNEISTVQELSKATTTTSSIVKPKKAKLSSTITANTNAWDTLFSTNQKAKKQNIARPMVAKPLSSELEAKLQMYPLFEDVTKRSDETVTLKLVAWNVNGVRAILKRDNSVHLRAYVAQEDPDIFCLSETKICCEELQKLEDFLPQYKHQFWSCGVKKGYASTAIFSKDKPLSIRDEIMLGDHQSKGMNKGTNETRTTDQEGRFLALEFEKFWLIHTYVPNAGGKLERLDFRTNQWDKAMLREMKEMDKSKPVIWCGDLNVAHQEIDIHNPKGNLKSAGFTQEERKSFSEILDAGFVDTFRYLYPDKVEYSYFGYRHNMRAKKKGWRLDYFVVSKALIPHVRSSFIRQSVTGSDHLPIGLELGELS